MCKAVTENILPVKKEGHGCLKTVVAWMTSVVPMRSGGCCVGAAGKKPLYYPRTHPAPPALDPWMRSIVSEIRTALKASRRHFTCFLIPFPIEKLNFSLLSYINSRKYVLPVW